VYNLSEIIAHTNFEHIQFGKNKTEFKKINGAYLRLTDKHPDVNLQSFDNLTENLRFFLSDDIIALRKKKLHEYYPYYVLSVNRKKKILLIEGQKRHRLFTLAENTNLGKKIQFCEAIYQKLSLAEMRAINFYATQRGHVLINGLLRDPAGFFKKEVLEKRSSHFCMSDLNALIMVIPHIAMLANALRKLEVLSVYRDSEAMRFINPYGLDFISSARTQEVMLQKGFISAVGIDPEGFFSPKKILAVLEPREITLEFKSTKGFWIALFSRFPNESEILMPPTPLQVLKATKILDKTVVIVRAVSDLQAYSANSMRQHSNDDETITAGLNYILSYRIFYLLSAPQQNNLLKKATFQSFWLYNQFDKDDFLTKNNKEKFLKLFDIIANHTPSKKIKKQIKEQIERLAICYRKSLRLKSGEEALDIPEKHFEITSLKTLLCSQSLKELASNNSISKTKIAEGSITILLLGFFGMLFLRNCLYICLPDKFTQDTLEYSRLNAAIYFVISCLIYALIALRSSKGFPSFAKNIYHFTQKKNTVEKVGNLNQPIVNNMTGLKK